MELIFRSEFGINASRPDDAVIYDLAKSVEEFLRSKSYGDLQTFVHVFRVGMENGFFNPVRQYSRKEDAVSISTNVETEVYKAIPVQDLKSFVAREMLRAILLCSTLRQKPKNFDFERMHSDLDLFLKTELNVLQ
ncbi:MAG: hypothetical protein HWE14_12750 [Flavobacteriia bacterium]|nr:hypothetical protein [Flavobacteriia bacterium]